MARVTGGQAVIDSLWALGVDTVFGIPGVHTLSIYDALHDHKRIRHITTRHEQGAGFMADGYARVTGRPGVCLVITGPGVTNIATPMGQAYSDSSPLLVISSTDHTRYLGRDAGDLHQLKDQLAFTEAVCAWSRRVDAVEDIPRALEDAFEYFNTSRPRPVHIEIPTDVLDGEGESLPASRPAPGDLSPDPALIDEAVRLMSGAVNPVMLVGGGVQEAGTVVPLAESLRLPVLSTAAGKGIFAPDHPLYLGARLRSQEARDLLAEADCLLVMGSALARVDMRWDALPETLIHVDIDENVPGSRYPTRLAIRADAGLAAGEMLERLGDVRVERDSEAEVLRLKQKWEENRGNMWPYLEAIREALPPEAVVVNDMTVACYQALGDFPSYRPRTFLVPQGFGTLGFSVPAALGAKLGRPDAPAVALIGDGGFMFTMNDLATGIRYRLGVPIVLFNNECYGVVKDIQNRNHGGRVIGVDIENPDFMDLARAYRIPGVRCPDPADLKTELARSLGRDLPTLIEIPLEGDAGVYGR